MDEHEAVYTLHTDADTGLKLLTGTQYTYTSVAYESEHGANLVWCNSTIYWTDLQ